MYDFLIGPMLALSLLVFAGGMAYRILQFFRLSKEAPLPVTGLPKTLTDAVKNREVDEYLHITSATDLLMKWRIRLRWTLFGRAPVFSILTLCFHGLLLMLPLVVTGHSILLDDYFSIGLPTLSESTADRLTLVFIGLFLFFLVRRTVSATVRSVTTYRDYIALFATGAPFITGCLAYHQLFDYHTLLYLHIISGELMLIAIPFTKLAHMPFLFLARLFIRNELSFGPGSRKWVETNS